VQMDTRLANMTGHG